MVLPKRRDDPETKVPVMFSVPPPTMSLVQSMALLLAKAMFPSASRSMVAGPVRSRMPTVSVKVEG